MQSFSLFSLDGIVSLPIFNKWACLLYVIYRNIEPLYIDGRLLQAAHSPVQLLQFLYHNINPWSIVDARLKFAYAILGVYFGAWLNVRWRNGLLGAPQRIRGKKEWGQELAFVTGGAQGIGKATVELLDQKGCNVAAVDILDFGSSYSNVKTYKCDISSLSDLQSVAECIKADFANVPSASASGLDEKNVAAGSPTMVLNIAGINNHSLILDLNEQKVQRMLDINLKSHFLTAMVFLPAMIKRKAGHFCSISSTMGLVGICHQSDYVATKHGLLGMYESLRYELDKMYRVPHVRTSVAIIGHTRTTLFNDFIFTHSLGRFLGPLVTPESIAQKVVNDALGKRESRYICHPFINHLAPIAKTLPSWGRDALQWSTGADGAYPSRPTKQQLGEA
ncbi:NAD(P)-binding protein [Tilletiaria anomala UBC 951]|uniref:NAD(P)-binding protein n=1 Tax=Tilletiaria anomala (strain ATCC 24038 / CBS 436.72 / UBC 951) TaxID=1037660 RepID=A0A066VUL0_TILAU|nr:NAD(P)-binding protein [Tilletiaria anomala UBC 951]KDN43958.1 NAD(P)-binding protein [Tilletiaria anomala UBC 951]